MEGVSSTWGRSFKGTTGSGQGMGGTAITATSLGMTLKRGESYPFCAKQEDGWQDSFPCSFPCHGHGSQLSSKAASKIAFGTPYPSAVLSIPRWGYVTDATTMGKSIGLFQTCGPGWAYAVSPVQQLFPCLCRARLGGKHLSSLLRLQSLPPVCIKYY